jgi:hypothetical protein
MYRNRRFSKEVESGKWMIESIFLLPRADLTQPQADLTQPQADLTQPQADLTLVLLTMSCFDRRR